MNEKNSKAGTLLEMLQKNNKNGLPLAKRLASEPERFEHFSRRLAGLLVDFSRTGLDAESFAALIELAACSGLEGERERLYSGEEINFTEHRAVLKREKSLCNAYFVFCDK